MAKRYAFVKEKQCAACGACENVCPREAIAVYRGCFATVDISLCVGCGLCEKVCPANAVLIRDRKDEKLGIECSLEDKATGACPMCSALATNVPYTPEIPLPSRRKKQ